MDVELNITIETILTQIDELLKCAEKIRTLSEPLPSIDPTIQ